MKERGRSHRKSNRDSCQLNHMPRRAPVRKATRDDISVDFALTPHATRVQPGIQRPSERRWEERCETGRAFCSHETQGRETLPPVSPSTKSGPGQSRRLCGVVWRRGTGACEHPSASALHDRVSSSSPALITCWTSAIADSAGKERLCEG